MGALKILIALSLLYGTGGAVILIVHNLFDPPTPPTPDK